MISILPVLKKSNMSSDEEITQLEAQLQKARADKARWKAEAKVVEEQQVAEEKAAAEAKKVTKSKAVAEEW